MTTRFNAAMRNFRRGTVVLLIASLAYVAGPVFQVSAVTTTVSTRTSDWLAAQVGSDGAVNVPGETFSTTTQTMYIASGLAASGQHRDALARAMSYIGLHVDEWVVNDSSLIAAPIGSALPARLAMLILLAHTVGGDPTSFGTPATNLLSRVQALYGVSASGFYGVQDPYSAVQDQSLVVMALLASGISPPHAAVQWISDQQCTAGSNPSDSVGGWQALRVATGNALNDCESDPLNWVGADTNSTAFAVQALKAAGEMAAIPNALTFLRSAQTSSGNQAGGFPWFRGLEPDSNSTALVIQALVAAGESVAGGAWSLHGASPISILATWQITTPGAEFGSMSFSDSYPGPNLLASYQGLWGLTLTAFPFPVLPALPAADPPTTDVPLAVPTFTG